MARTIGVIGLNPDFGRVIYNLRKKHDVSQRNLARAAGVDRASLRRLEMGESRGNAVMIATVLATLGYAATVSIVRTDGLPDTKKLENSRFTHSTVGRRAPYGAF